MSDVRRVLDPDEVDYAAAARLGAEALPLLHELVRGQDPGVAAKAAYLAGVIGGEHAEPVLADAAGSDDPRVRVAAASAASMLQPQVASRVLTALVVDDDPGVQKHALRSVPAQASPALRSSVERASTAAPEPDLRSLAAQALDRSR